MQRCIAYGVIEYRAVLISDDRFSGTICSIVKKVFLFTNKYY